MALPSSGIISFSQLAAELGNACSNVGLRAYSACANLTSPDGIIELRGKICTPVFGAGVWSSGGITSTSRQGPTGFGTQNEALAAGGTNPYGNCYTLDTEEYNGTSWSTGGALIKGRFSGVGAGTQNAGLAAGGYTADVIVCYDEFEDPYNSCTFYIGACTEEYNGTSWSAGGAMIGARYRLAGAGTQNAGLVAGGESFVGYLACTEEYNGTSWSAGGSIITARRLVAGAGTQNEGLVMGGGYPLKSCTEEYNGTSWSTGGSLINAREGAAGAGTQNAGLAVGGSFNISGAFSEEYNGTSWSAGGALITGRYALAGAGTQGAGLVVGGVGSGYDGRRTEEYNKPIIGKCLA